MKMLDKLAEGIKKIKSCPLTAEFTEIRCGSGAYDDIKNQIDVSLGINITGPFSYQGVRVVQDIEIWPNQVVFKVEFKI